MFDPKVLLDTIMQSGVSSTGTDRMKHALGEKGLGGQGGLLSGLLGGGQQGGGLLAGLFGGGSQAAGGGLGALADKVKGMLGGSSSGGSGGQMALGGLGALAGALLGGGGGAVKGAMGGGMMALLGSLAVSALKGMNRPLAAEDAHQMPLGLREPQDEREEKELQDNALIILRGMINAAKADGQIDRDEIQRITGKLQEAGADAAARDFVLGELGKPSDLDAILKAVPNREVGAQVYAASLLSIKVDTPAEKDYMRRLAEGLDLGPEAVFNLHQVLGVPSIS